MHSVVLLSAAFASLLAPTLAAQPPVRIEEFKGRVKQGSYIVQLSHNVSKETHIDWVGSRFGKHVVTRHDWDFGNFTAYAGTFHASDLPELQSHPDVVGISQDYEITTHEVLTQCPMGTCSYCTKYDLADRDPNMLNYKVPYDSKAGQGVDIYIVDSGIMVEHEQFGGRAAWAPTSQNYSETDLFGHGTHVAGIAGSSQFGVAKNANLIAVKVFPDRGNTSLSNVLSGLSLVMSEASKSNRSSVVNMSFGGPASEMLDKAVTAVSAGNDNTNADDFSPARASHVVTVGATTITDARAPYSNYGDSVDIFAPGEDIISTWPSDQSATMFLSGTSMAAPFVAGVIACYLSDHGKTNPGAMSVILKQESNLRQITSVPSGTPNLFLQALS